MSEQAYDRYRRIQVETASPVQLIIMMYEGITRFLNQAAASMEASDYATAERMMDRSTAIVNELLGVLDFEAGGDVAQNLGSVYTMTIREVLSARLRRNPEKLKKLAYLYADLKTGWAGIASARAV